MKFEVDTTQLQSAARQMSDTLGGISSDRAGMFAALEALDGMWTGQAHDAFTVQYHNDNEMMVSLARELTQLAERVAKTRQSYDLCEDAAVEKIAAIRV